MCLLSQTQVGREEETVRIMSSVYPQNQNGHRCPCTPPFMLSSDSCVPWESPAPFCLPWSTGLSPGSQSLSHPRRP